jgi:phosphoglycerate dehydrogenase-like enzyme
LTEKPLVLVLGAGPDDEPPGIREASRWVDLAFAASGPDLAMDLEHVQGIFIWRAKFWRSHGDRLAQILPQMASLRWVQAGSDGVDGLLLPELVAGAAQVTNARGVFDDSIAEWAIGAMLAFASRILVQRDAQLRGEWVYGQTERLAGRRLLVVGPGPIGRAIARRATALGMSVSAVGRSARRDDLFGDIGDPDGFHDSLAGADWVVDALPLTDETRHMFDRAAFAAMPSTARFMNVGRGGTVDEPVMVEALETGEIAGAALDVFEEEPLPASSPLWAMANVLISPHMCGDFEGWEREVVGVFVENARRFALGEPLVNLVDKKAGFGVD